MDNGDVVNNRRAAANRWVQTQEALIYDLFIYFIEEQ
jgi:hypothetical protein